MLQNVMVNVKQMTLHTKSSQTVKTLDWTSSNLGYELLHLSSRLAAIDGGTVPHRRLDFFYSNTNNFVQLEDTTIKTERCCSMQCTERTIVVHHSSLGLHCAAALRGRPDFL